MGTRDERLQDLFFEDQTAEGDPAEEGLARRVDDQIKIFLNGQVQNLINEEGQGYTIFAIWAEENAVLNNNNREWSFGNGATGDIGIILPTNCDLFAIGLEAEIAGTATVVTAEKDGATVASSDPLTGNSNLTVLGSPVAFAAGEKLGFQTITAGGASDVRVVAWFRIPATPINTLLIGDLLDVDTTTAPTNGQVLEWNGAAFVPTTITSGEANTASNIGTGADVFSSKVGDDLEFRGIEAGSTKITTTVNGDNVDIDADSSVIEAEQSSAPRPPTSHASTHQDAGGDEIDVTNLSGLLADPQTPLAHNSTHANGGGDELNVAGLSGLLADSQTPLGHSTSHEVGGSDEISVAGLQGVLADDQNPVSHASDHENGGGDEINVAGLSGVLVDPQPPIAHASDHESGGTDVLALGSIAGEITDSQHGDRSGGTLHPDAISSGASGFLSGADKTKLDGLVTSGETTVSVSANDTTPSTLDDKITVGAGLLLTELNDGGDEDLEISVDRHTAYVAASSTTTSTTFQEKLRLPGAGNITLVAGTYEVWVSYGWNHDSASNDFEGRLMVNGVVSGEIHKQEPKDSAGGGIGGTSQRHYLTRRQELVLAAGNYNFSIEYRTDAGGNESSIWEASIIVRQIA